MNRNILFKWYDTPRGRILQQSETAFLKHSLTVGCKQTIVQVGVLGWEKEFIDCSLYQHFLVIDNTARDCQAAHRIQAEPDQLPVLSNSADMVILPHLLEFSDNQHQILREVERILKPEGKLIILNFNPWSFWVWHQYFWDQKKPDSLRGNFISRTKIVDWLKLLNFGVEIARDSEPMCSLQEFHGRKGTNIPSGWSPMRSKPSNGVIISSPLPRSACCGPGWRSSVRWNRPSAAIATA